MQLTGNKVILAPMAGISDRVFRSLCKLHGADVVVSEMVSAEGLLYGADATFDLLTFSESERPIGIQLFGCDPDRLAEAAKVVEERVHPDFIDLNSGCPVQKVIKKNGGSYLLKDRPLFEKIITTMTKAIKTPLTVKIRSGWYTHQWVDIEFAKAAQDCGASAVTLHPRSQKMGFSGHSYWERIAEVKKVLSIPLIGNGDIVVADDALKMIRETGCDSVMIGRASYGNPYIFGQIKAALEGKSVLETPFEMRKQTALDHIKAFRETYGERRTAAEMKKHVSWYMKGIPGASKMRDQVFRAEHSEELEAVVRTFFCKPLISNGDCQFKSIRENAFPQRTEGEWT